MSQPSAPDQVVDALRRARSHVASSQSTNLPGDERARHLAVAQVWATLALVEEQRTANLLALLDLDRSNQEQIAGVRYSVLQRLGLL